MQRTSICGKLDHDGTSILYLLLLRLREHCVMERVQEPGSDWGEIMASVHDGACGTRHPGIGSRSGCLHKVKPINISVLVEVGLTVPPTQLRSCWQFKVAVEESVCFRNMALGRWLLTHSHVYSTNWIQWAILLAF